MFNIDLFVNEASYEEMSLYISDLFFPIDEHPFLLNHRIGNTLYIICFAAAYKVRTHRNTATSYIYNILYASSRLVSPPRNYFYYFLRLCEKRWVVSRAEAVCVCVFSLLILLEVYY